MTQPQTLPDLARILVVVPTLNEADHIVPCLTSVLSGNPALSVVVADGGSTDRTRALVAGLMAQYPHLRIVDNPDRLQSAGINRAVAECSNPALTVLVRCDAHADYPPGYVMSVAEAVNRNGVASVVVPMDSVAKNRFRPRRCLDRRYATGVGWVGASRGAPVRSGGSWASCGHVVGVVPSGRRL